MSFPDPNSFISPPPLATTGGGGGGSGSGDYWSSFTIPTNDQPIPQSDNIDPSFKRQRLSENPMIPAQFPPVNPRTNLSTSRIFYKTRICARFMEGTCRNGEQCTFAHGPEDLREPPPNWQDLVREKERGGNNIGTSDDQRVIHRMKICNKYYNGEECPYGDKCNFIHERAPGYLSNKQRADVSGQRESYAIRLTSDTRRSGVDVVQTGASWKTKICGKWETGQCPYGEKCNFAHGTSDLKPSGAADEAIMAANNTSSINIQRRSQSVSSFNATPAANLATFAPPNRGSETDRASRWKTTKRINRIYGDWLDDGSPPRASSFAEDEG